ncbi:MAG: lipase family protein [Candidatus Hydrogenedentes bacterium]|nr:lipase family protein [Candidatus Hydrogenedentota bacterium]
MAYLFDYDASWKSLLTPCQPPFFNGWTPRSDAALCAELSRLAYCGGEVIGETLPNIGMRLVKVIDEMAGKGTFGFLAKDEARAVLVFRGTESTDPSDVIDDVRFFPCRWEFPDGTSAEVHSGFADALNRVLAEFEAAVAGISAPLIITGHSLGAALACLAASRVPARALYTFGGPRVGDDAFCQNMAARVETHRYRHCCDVVCEVPTPPLYKHFGTLHYIDRNGNCSVDVTNGQIVADQVVAQAEYLRAYAFRPGNVFSRSLADHTPLNYVSALARMADRE